MANDRTASTTPEGRARHGEDLGALLAEDSWGDGLVFFTQEIGGHLFDGWYRCLPDSSIEVFTPGSRVAAPLDGADPDSRAKQLLTEVVCERLRNGWHVS